MPLINPPTGRTHLGLMGVRLWLARLAMALLGLTLLSGVALVPLYDPARALESMEAIDGGLPWGWWLRGLHRYAADGLLMVGMAHGVDVIVGRRSDRLGPALWWRSVLLGPVLVLAMLSGFVMRADAEAMAALWVWRGILESVPAVGSGLARLCLGGEASGLGPVSIHHCATLSLLTWGLSAEHGRRLWPDTRSFVLATMAAVTLAALVPVSLGAPPGSTTDRLLLGPWYLLGLQGALVDLPPAVGWVAPVSVVAMVGMLRHVEGGPRRGLNVAVFIGVIVYGGLTLRLLVGR